MYNAGMSNKKKRAREKRLEEEKNRKKEPVRLDIRRRDPFLSYATGVMLLLSAVIAVSYIIVAVSNGIENGNQRFMVIFCIVVTIACVYFARRYILEGNETRRMKKEMRG